MYKLKTIKMAEYLVPVLMWLCAIAVVTSQASPNVTDAHLINDSMPVPQSKGKITWPPFAKNESVPSVTAPPAITPLKGFKPSSADVGNPSIKTTTTDQRNSPVATTPPITLEGRPGISATQATMASQYPRSTASVQSSSSTSSPVSSAAPNPLLTPVSRPSPGISPKSARPDPGVRPGTGTVDPTSGTYQEEHVEHVSIAVFLAVPICVGLIISFFILFGKYCRKKLRLDKLRHQLMPMYNFDPAEGEDWETELLTEPKAQVNPNSTTTTQQTQPASTRPTGSTEVPQLRLSAPAVQV